MRFDMPEALSYRDTGRCTDALKALYKRLDTEKENLVDNSDMRFLYRNIGYVHLELKEYDKAIEFFDSSIMYCDKNSTYYNYKKLSKFYAKANETGLSIEHNEMTRKYYRKMGEHSARPFFCLFIFNYHPSSSAKFFSCLNQHSKP